MKKILVSLAPILLLIVIAVAFYWKFFFKGLIPFPGDLMVGSYLPWLDYKWGNVVGVAVKNNFISDIYSAFYPWKVSFAQMFLSHQWPAWNSYLYSGYPLYANFNSGYLNPFNLLLTFFGAIKGWSLLVISQPVFSMISMYGFLRAIKKERYSAVVGAVVYGFGGFAMTWSQYVNAGFVMIWLPLILLSIELAKQKGKDVYLLALTPIFFLVVTAGHFQGLVYTAVISIAYFIFRHGLKQKSKIITFILYSLLAVGLSTVQLLPTYELLNLSVRFDDGMIAGYNYGLLPAQNLVTMVAPDFFGNPSTANFWGFYNYHETIAYAGIFGLLALIFGLLNFGKLTTSKFFVVSGFISLLFLFDTPLGRAIYVFKAPFLYTSAAGRIGMIYLLSVSILSAELTETVEKMKWKEKLKLFFTPISILLVSGGMAFAFLTLFKRSFASSFLLPDIQHMTVAVRNIAIPLGLVASFYIVFLATKWKRVWRSLLILLIVGDLFRFGWKYLPFVPEKYVFPATEVTDFIKKDKTIFRVDKERGEILPPNTWMGYDLMSPSGFDPLAVKEYVKAYREDLNGATGGSVSRYSELDRIEAGPLGKYNVKYFLAIKRNDIMELGGENLSYKINQKEWKRVFDTKSVAVLLNTKYKERARIVDDRGNDAKGTAIISSYENNRVVIDFENIDGTKLLLSDTYYPGWHAKLNGTEVEVGKEIRPFRSIKIEKGSKGQVVFEFWPETFALGLKISAISLVLWAGISCFLLSRRKK